MTEDGLLVLYGDCALSTLSVRKDYYLFLLCFKKTSPVISSPPDGEYFNLYSSCEAYIQEGQEEQADVLQLTEQVKRSR